MRAFIFFLIIILCGTLQATVLGHFRVFNVKPDLLLLDMVMASLIFKPRLALSFSIFAGIFKDAFSAYTFGINMVLFPLWSLLIIFLSGKITLEDDYIRLGLALSVAFIHNMAAGLLSVSAGSFIPLGILLRIIFVGAIYTGASFFLFVKFATPLLAFSAKRHQSQ